MKSTRRTWVAGEVSLGHSMVKMLKPRRAAGAHQAQPGTVRVRGRRAHHILLPMGRVRTTGAGRYANSMSGSSR